MTILTDQINAACTDQSRCASNSINIFWKIRSIKIGKNNEFRK